MPTLNELIDGFANKQTCERIKGVVQAGLEDVHNHAVRIKALQSKPGVEKLVALVFPRLTELVKEIEDEDRKEAATQPEHRDAPSKVNWGIPAPKRKHSNSPSDSNRLVAGGASPAERALHRALGGNG